MSSISKTSGTPGNPSPVTPGAPKTSPGFGGIPKNVLDGYAKAMPMLGNLAMVQNPIQQVLNDINGIQRKESQEQDAQKAGQEGQAGVNGNLERTAQSRQSIADQLKLG